MLTAYRSSKMRRPRGIQKVCPFMSCRRCITLLTADFKDRRLCDGHETVISCFAGKTLTDDCKKELSDFRIELGESINRNLPLGEDYNHISLMKDSQASVRVQIPATLTCAFVYCCCASNLHRYLRFTILFEAAWLPVQQKPARMMQLSSVQTRIPQTL